MFKLITKTHELLKYIVNMDSSQIGLVPTMGNLHEGHLSLVEESLKGNSLTIVTIFVNPKQFGPNEDFDKYPRTLEQDCDKLERILTSERELIVFAPESVDEVFPPNFATKIEVSGITDILCGATRSGHFSGVTTVVHRLFSLTKAKNTYFGQKDFQQVKVIERMIEDLGMDVTVNMIPISRDEDGLARSSRNQYLSSEQREEALILSQTISQIEEELNSKTWIEAGVRINEILERITASSNWEYLEILDAKNLANINRETIEIVILGAYHAGKTRLIDNKMVKIKYA